MVFKGVILAAAVVAHGCEKKDSEVANQTSTKVLDMETCQVMGANASQDWCHQMNGWDTKIAEP